MTVHLAPIARCSCCCCNALAAAPAIMSLYTDTHGVLEHRRFIGLKHLLYRAQLSLIVVASEGKHSLRLLPVFIGSLTKNFAVR